MAELLKYGVVTALGGAIVYANLPTRWTLGNIVPTVQYLRDTELRRIEAGNKLNKPEKASNLFAQGPVLVIAFRRLGCLFCRVGAHDVTQLKPELDKAGVRLRRFFGPNERWMPLWMGFLRPRTYVKLFQGWRRGIKAGELSAGEGRLLGDDDVRILWIVCLPEVVLAKTENGTLTNECDREERAGHRCMRSTTNNCAKIQP
ncbi:Redox-regulatory protein [Toxocara canis]|uniref:Redox-regulatory protein n=1 Tax=Toxocara canis TaxID=6265 RepID=A0A0B2W369_TOXCA|nr:Redox-regulatory protein [Toxocara canis]